MRRGHDNGWVTSTRGQRSTARLGLVAIAVRVLAGCGGTDQASLRAPTGQGQTSSSSTAAPPPSSPAPPPPPSATSTPSLRWDQVLERAQSSVVRLDVQGCDRQWTGSGFVVGDGIVMTAAHVIDGAASITVQQGASEASANTVALDRQHDSALIRMKSPGVTAKALPLRDQDPPKGSALGILGYPLGTHDLRITTGILSGVDESIRYEGDVSAQIAAEHSYVTDAVINGGNSGGPVLDLNGTVIGLVTGKAIGRSGNAIEGTGFVVPARYLADNLANWRNITEVMVLNCGGGAPPSSRSSEREFEVTIDGVTTPKALGIRNVLQEHGRAINRGQYSEAWRLFTPRMKNDIGSYDSWRGKLSSAFWINATLLGVRDDDNGRSLADVRLQTRQEPRDGYEGQSCSEYYNRYRMVRESGQWRIDKVSLIAGPPRLC